MKRKEEVRKFIRKRYTAVAKNESRGCCGGGCSCGSAPLDITEASKLIGYDLKELAGIPQEANMGLGWVILSYADLRKGKLFSIWEAGEV